MNKLSLTLLIMVLAFSRSSFAQQNTVPQRTFKYGKVDLKEFETKVEGPDSAAPAVILFDVGKSIFELSGQKFSFVYVLERHVRYKIISKAGYDYANMEIALFNVAGQEAYLADLDGATYNLENGKIVTSKITKSSKFTEKQDKNFTIKKFALPNVKEGSIIEFKYKIKSDFLGTLMPWYFQRNIPTLYSEFDVSIPQYFKYRVTQNGLIDIKPTRTLSNQNMVSFYGSGNVQIVRNVYRAQDIPALKGERYITSTEDYVSKVEFELNSVAMPGTGFLNYIKSWPKIVMELGHSNGFGGFLAQADWTKNTVNKIIKPGTKPDTVPYLIFDYVKNNLKWNGYNNIYGSLKGPEDVFEKKIGNSADINLTLLALLKEAKVDANPIILSTRGNGKHPGFPMLSKFNNVIIDVKLGERHIFFDATNRNHTPDIIAFENLNHTGLKVDFSDNSGKWVNTDEFKISKGNVTGHLVLDKENKLTGTMQLYSTNYTALERRNKYLSAANEADFLKSYQSDRPGLEIRNYKTENLDNPNDPFGESMDVTIDGSVEEAGDLIYFTPLLYERTKENPFTIDERKYPVDFGHPVEEVYAMTIEIPKDYTLDKLPKSEKVSLLDDAASFSFLVTQEGNKISIMSKISFKKSVYSIEEYHDLKELFKNIVRKHSEQIVVKKS